MPEGITVARKKVSKNLKTRSPIFQRHSATKQKLALVFQQAAEPKMAQSSNSFTMYRTVVVEEGPRDRTASTSSRGSEYLTNYTSDWGPDRSAAEEGHYHRRDSPDCSDDYGRGDVYKHRHDRSGSRDRHVGHDRRSGGHDSYDRRSKKSKVIEVIILFFCVSPPRHENDHRPLFRM
jgi:hypothetical protein